MTRYDAHDRSDIDSILKFLVAIDKRFELFMGRFVNFNSRSFDAFESSREKYVFFMFFFCLSNMKKPEKFASKIALINRVVVQSLQCCLESTINVHVNGHSARNWVCFFFCSELFFYRNLVFHSIFRVFVFFGRFGGSEKRFSLFKNC